MRWICSIAACALITATPNSARSADVPSSTELNEARERFAAGRKLEEAGRFGEALVTFQSVGRVKMTPQVRFHIALCLMHTGKPVEALANFRTAAQEADGTAPTVVAEARAHIATLEQQVAVVTVDVPSTESTWSITFDERVVARGEAFDAEPGDHRVRLSRAGQTVDERPLTLRAGERSRIELAPGIESTNVPRVASVVAFGVAGASVVGLGVFALLRADRLSELEAVCPSFSGCNRSLEPVVRDGKMYSTAVNTFAGVAAAATVAGVVLHIVSRSSASSRSSQVVDVEVHPVVGLGGGFVTLQGRF